MTTTGMTITTARVNSALDAAIVIDDIPQGMAYRLAGPYGASLTVVRTDSYEYWVLTPDNRGHRAIRKQGALDFVLGYFGF